MAVPKAHAFRSFLPTTREQMDLAPIANDTGRTYQLSRALTASLVSCTVHPSSAKGEAFITCMHENSRHEPAS